MSKLTSGSETTHKRKALHSDLFTKELFEENDLLIYKNTKTHREVNCLSCL